MTLRHITLADFTADIDQAVVAAWHVCAGDVIREDDDLLDIVTDKATIVLPAPCAGVVRSIVFEQGRSAAPRDVLLTLEVES